MSVKRIGILTSGGDSPGMNAAVRAVVMAANKENITVYGIRKGYRGLIENDYKILRIKNVDDIVNRGGTILHTARCEEFERPDVRKQAYENTVVANKLDGLVVIGGDGTFTGARLFMEERNVPTVGIPGTIDNDLVYTDYTLGFDTAVNTILSAIYKIRDTMTSHDRVCVVEVMGKECGQLAMHAGLAGGAECVIIPEIKIKKKDIYSRLLEAHKNGERGIIVVLAEGAGKGEQLSREIEENTDLETRASVLGYIQRGGVPSAGDVLLACQFGERAVSLLKRGVGKRAIGIENNKIVDIDFLEATSMKKPFDRTLYDLANKLSR